MSAARQARYGGSLTGTAAGATFLVSGGTASVTYSGGITQANNAPMVIHRRRSQRQARSLSRREHCPRRTARDFNSITPTASTYNFNGHDDAQWRQCGIDILDGSAGTFNFGSEHQHHESHWHRFRRQWQYADRHLQRQHHQERHQRGLAWSTSRVKPAGTITFQTGTLSSTSSAGTGLQFNNADGTVQLQRHRRRSMAAMQASILLNGSAGTFSFGGTTITNPTGVALNVDARVPAAFRSAARSRRTAGAVSSTSTTTTRAPPTFPALFRATPSCDGIEVTNNGAGLRYGELQQRN